MAEQDRMVVCVSYFFIRLIATSARDSESWPLARSSASQLLSADAFVGTSSAMPVGQR
jgi:hypothetical protein